jgi:hypothetical protein
LLAGSANKSAACCDRLDRTFDSTRTLYPDGVLTMINDEDLIDFEFADFWAVVETKKGLQPKVAAFEDPASCYSKT